MYVPPLHVSTTSISPLRRAAIAKLRVEVRALRSEMTGTDASHFLFGVDFLEATAVTPVGRQRAAPSRVVSLISNDLFLDVLANAHRRQRRPCWTHRARSRHEALPVMTATEYDTIVLRTEPPDAMNTTSLRTSPPPRGRSSNTSPSARSRRAAPRIRGTATPPPSACSGDVLAFASCRRARIRRPPRLSPRADQCQLRRSADVFPSPRTAHSSQSASDSQRHGAARAHKPCAVRPCRRPRRCRRLGRTNTRGAVARSHGPSMTSSVTSTTWESGSTSNRGRTACMALLIAGLGWFCFEVAR